MPMVLLLTASRSCRFFGVIKRKFVALRFTLEFAPGFTVKPRVTQRSRAMSMLKKLLGKGGFGGGHQPSGHGRGHHGNRYNQQGGQGPQCPQCQAPNLPGARYCHRCGQPFDAQAAACRQCATPLAPGSRFCPQCGEPAGAQR